MQETVIKSTVLYVKPSLLFMHNVMEDIFVCIRIFYYNFTLHVFIWNYCLNNLSIFFIVIAEWITTLKQPLQIKGNKF
jgi:hypothetical protein